MGAGFRCDLVIMIIDLASVGNAPKMLEMVLEPADIDLDGESVLLSGQTKFRGEIEGSSMKARLRGTIDTDVLLVCTRCLEPVNRNLGISFEAVFVDSGEENTDEAAEIGDEQLDESIVEGGKIDIAETVREQLLLALPEQVFCSDDCKGLCPKCGANRNLIDCKCADDEVDPRWAALKNLK